MPVAESVRLGADVRIFSSLTWYFCGWTTADQPQVDALIEMRNNAVQAQTAGPAGGTSH